MSLSAHRPRAMVVVAVGACALLLVSACSSSSKSSGSPSSSPAGASSTGKAATGTPYKIVTIDDDTPQNPVTARHQTGQELVKEINAAGGVNGHPLELKFCNSQLTPTATLACARSAAADTSVIATVGDYTVATGNATGIFDKARLAQIGSFAVAQADYTCKTCFPLTGGTTAVVAGQATVLPDVIKAKKLGAVVVDVPVAHGLPALYSAALAAQGSAAKIVKTIYIPTTATDMSTYVAALTSAGVDGIVMTLSIAAATSFVRAVAAQSPNMPIGSSLSTFSLHDIAKLGSAGKNLYFASMTAQSGSAYDDFLRLQKAAGVSNNGGDDSAVEYSAIKAFVAIASKLPSVTRDTFYQAALTSKSNDGGGLVRPVDFTGYNNKDLGGAFPRLIPYVFYAKVDSGKVIAVGSGKPVNVFAPYTGS